MALPSGSQPMELLNTMGNFNEKTINKISFNVLKIFNMYKESNGCLNFAEYNLNLGSIACGGSNGLLNSIRVALDPKVMRPLSYKLTSNQTLEGHQFTVLQCCWNEYTQRLTTFNANGVIVDYAVGQNETLYENMVNEKKQDPPIRVAWNRLGTRIGLVYADGLVMVGKDDGGPAFVRQFDFQLASFEWGPDDLLILGTAEGTVKVFDMDGEHQLDVYLPCLEAVELEHALAKKDYREEIVRMSYWSPVLMSQLLQTRREENEQKRRDEEKERNSLGISIFSNYRPTPEPNETEKASEPVQPVPPDRPRFMVAYSTGVIQLMRNLMDRDPIVVRLPNLKLSEARWSPNGAFIAVSGSIIQQTGVHQCLYFLSAYGQVIGFHQQLGSPFNTVSWEATGYRVAISSGGRLIIGQLRPQYKWGSIEDTLVYVYQNEEPFYYSVMFFDYETGEKTTKTVKYFENLACYKEHCVVIFREEDMSYHCDLCNSIGTAMDYVVINFQPKFVQVNGVAAVIASEDRYFIWYFNLPKPDTFLGEKMEVEGETGEYVLTEQQRPVEYGTKRLLGSKDQISSMCIGDTFFLIALRGGGIYRINLSDGAITLKYAVAGTVDAMKLNCDFTKVALTKVLDSAPLHLYIYDFMNDGALLQKSFTTEKTLIMDFQWDAHNPNMIAYKTNKELPGEIFVYDGASALKQGVANGFIYSFKNLVVTSVNLDSIMFNPENPSKNSRIETMIKAKSDVETMLYHGRLTEAMEYAEKSPHDELWSMIATYSVKNHHYDTAEHAFVKLQDYAGLQFVKKLRNISEIGLRNAEILAYEEKLEEAKEMFVLCDRKDLAIEMYKKLDEPHQVSELLKHDNNEEQKLKAYRNLAEVFYEEMDWDESLKYFKKCEDIPMQIDCLVRANQFGRLEELVRNLDNDCEHLEFIGDIFSSRGLCDQAIECYLKCGLPKKAFDTCVELHQLQKAQFIAESHQLVGVEWVLVKHAEDTVGENDEDSIIKLGLYMKAGRHLEAAEIAFQIAKDRKDKLMPFNDLKECYVLGAILVENHRQGVQELKRMEKHRLLTDALSDESGLTVEQTRILENTWKGAEAFHFIMLAWNHFFNDRIQDALHTSVLLADYQEYLDPVEIHQMIAVAAANCGQFQICSRAMMWLEAYEGFSDAERQEMKDLSFELFSKCPPVNPPNSKMRCLECDGEMNRYDSQCPGCQFKLPICMAIGKPILENTSWVCRRCKHHVNKYEIKKWTYCPLCHDTEDFNE